MKAQTPLAKEGLESGSHMPILCPNHCAIGLKSRQFLLKQLPAVASLLITFQGLTWSLHVLLGGLMSQQNRTNPF